MNNTQNKIQDNKTNPVQQSCKSGGVYFLKPFLISFKSTPPHFYMMNYKSLMLALFITSLFLLGVNSAQAAPMNLNQLIKSAVDNNPELKSRKLTWQKLIHQYPQATAYADPRLTYTEAINPIETRLGPQDRVLALKQKLPFKGKRGLKGEIVKKDIEIAKINFNKASRDLVVAVKKSFYELVYIENAIKLSMQNKGVLEKITHIATTDYASSASTLNDVAKAQSQYAQVSYDVLLLEELRSTEKTQINTLLNRKPEQPFQINSAVRQPPKFSHAVARLYQWAESNEENSIADLNIQKSQVQTKLSNYASLPDFDLGAAYSQIGKRDVSGLEHNGRDAFSINIGINIPLNRGKNNAIKEQARITHLKKVEDKKALKNRLNRQVKSNYFKLNNAYRQTVLYSKNLIPQANRAMQIAQLQYKENKGSIAAYLETQSTWLNFQLSYQRAVADYWKNLIELEKITGKKL
ncbi:MAG: TolC family protein [Cocleimonas sp.]|nr:TolC family protein [Cocleimonas sp.]